MFIQKRPFSVFKEYIPLNLELRRTHPGFFWVIHKHQSNIMRILQKYLVPIAFLCCLFSLSGCSASHLLVLDPQEPIARGERDLRLITVGLMLLVIIPVFVLTFWFAWKYRASNPHGDYS
ncbi:MAG: hypothetical protein ACYCZH_00930 [Sulfuriferula sp.]